MSLPSLNKVIITITITTPNYADTPYEADTELGPEINVLYFPLQQTLIQWTPPLNGHGH